MTPAEIETAFDEAENEGTDRQFWQMMRYISDDDQRLVEWESRVRALLTHRNDLFVAEAVTVLASRWKLAGFRAECMEFASHDDEEVRLAALSGLDGYGLRSADLALATFFLDVLTDKTRSYKEGRIAALAIPRVLEGNLPEFVDVRRKLWSFRGSKAEFDRLVPWDALEELMEKHRPSH